ncbi:hypothetical protein GWD52_09275 [Enterobacteriaceae bacterium 4M9]|nr:hypothetical protein [Enterobacteriaceae bacterium 4M9]
MKGLIKYLTRLAKRLLSFFSYLIPKKNNRIFFKSKPDYSGNCKAVSDYIVANKLDYEIIWSVKEINKSNTFISVESGSFKSLYYYLTSKFIMTTHNEMIGIAAKNQIYISLWHGMPLKKICYLGEFDYLGMEDYSSKRIATSELMRSVISACFREKANNVYVTGQPRNDYLFSPVALSSLAIEARKDDKILLYIPTFRQNNEDRRYSDGKGIDHNNFLRVNDFDLESLDKFLSENKIHLLLKLHPYEEVYFKNKKSLTPNITVIDSENLASKNIDLNQLLPSVDCLITDYSSVYFDYLILNKPLIFLVPDLIDYGHSRGGFTLEPFEFWTPGNKVSSQHQLIAAINEAIFGDDEYINFRTEINRVINHYQDGNSSKRVVEFFLEKNK